MQRLSTTKAGFSLVELMLTVLILAILAGIVIPRMGWATMGKVQAKTAARQFANYLKLTRSLAITHASSNDEGANWCEATQAFDSGDYGTPGVENDSCSP